MPIISWRTKKQFLYFGIFVLVIFVIIAGIFWFFSSKATCFNGIKNQGEENIDCGGPCPPCLGEIKEINILWQRFFKSRENFYDISALIENKNLFAGLTETKYQFKIYDANNILIASREGKTFINPDSKKIIFESNVFMGPRAPKYIYFELNKEQNWKYLKKEKAPLSVVNKNFTNNPFPRLTADIRNISSFDIEDVFIEAILYDEDGNAQGISSTKIDLIAADSIQSASFTWPQKFDKEPASIEIFPDIDLTK